MTEQVSGLCNKLPPNLVAENNEHPFLGYTGHDFGGSLVVWLQSFFHDVGSTQWPELAGI